MKKEQIIGFIKPLKWDDGAAYGVCGLYEIEIHDDESLYSLRFIPDNYNGENDTDLGKYETKDAAKLIAEKEHQEEILGYLNLEA